MNLLDLFVKISCKDDASSQVEGIGKNVVGKMSGAASLIKTALTGAAVAGAASFVKSAVDSYASYEQLVGGVKKLYGAADMDIKQYAQSVGKSVSEVKGEYEQLNKAQDLVMENASKAFKTAGMSANQYMEQATSFSAALINSLGGDTVKAAELTDVAMTAMADNVNTFGSDMGSVQNAFQGFSKQNYTMLDNLKLGYGGTKSEMEKLIKDANEYAKANGEAADLSIDSFADIVTAIDLIQKKQQIAGTTSREAATTIEGSVSSAKAAWENWTAGLGQEDADMGALTDQLVESIETAAENIIPRVGEILTSLADVFVEKGPEIVQGLADTLVSLLPGGVQDAVNSVEVDFSGLFGGLSNAFDGIKTGLEGMFENLASTLESNGVGDIIQELADSLGEIGSVVGELAALVLPIIGNILGAGITLFLTIISKAAAMLAFVVKIPGKIVAFFTSLPDKIKTIFENVKTGATNVFDSLVSFVSGIPDKILNALGSVGSLLTDAGKGIIDGFLNGLKESWKKVTDFVGGIADWIANNKGPLDYDKKLLIPAGHAIMGGLYKSMKEGWKDVQGLVDEMGAGISSDFQLSYGAGTPAPAPAAIADGITGSGAGNVYNTYNVNVNGAESPEKWARKFAASSKRIARMNGS